MYIHKKKGEFKIMSVRAKDLANELEVLNELFCQILGQHHNIEDETITNATLDDINKNLESLHTKILRNRISEEVTESEMIAFCQAKEIFSKAMNADTVNIIIKDSAAISKNLKNLHTKILHNSISGEIAESEMLAFCLVKEKLSKLQNV